MLINNKKNLGVELMKKLSIHKKLLVLGTVFMMLFSYSLALGADKVVSFGQDLNMSQRDAMARYFQFVDAKSIDVPVVYVSNAEERRYLKGIVPSNVIGSRAISSAMVQLLGPGQGIHVATENITWVTDEMFANALTTAKIKDAEIKAGAPFPVSGTAALTGMFKAFEKATGQKIDETAKKVANEELVKMGQLGDAIGDKQKAATLIMKVKEEIVKNNVTDPAKQGEIVKSVANDLNIQLTDQQIQQIVDLMQRISHLNLNINDIRSQLTSISEKLNQLVNRSEEVKGLLQRIIDALTGFIDRVLSFFK